MNEKAMHKLSYGLFVLTAKDGDRDNGCIINTAIQAASAPNQLSICVNKANFTHDMIKKTGKFVVSIISQGATFDLFKHFGFQSGRDVDKFADFTDCRRLANGTLAVTRGTNAYITGHVTQTVDLGTHTLFIVDVDEMETLTDDASATYNFYQANIKPRPQAVKKTVWRCAICGYEYEGETLPDDFICPWCKHPASDFVKVEA